MSRLFEIVLTVVIVGAGIWMLVEWLDDIIEWVRRR